MACIFLWSSAVRVHESIGLVSPLFGSVLERKLQEQYTFFGSVGVNKPERSQRPSWPPLTWNQSRMLSAGSPREAKANAIILTDSVSLLQRVSGMGSLDRHATMVDFCLQRITCGSTFVDVLESVSFSFFLSFFLVFLLSFCPSLCF